MSSYRGAQVKRIVGISLAALVVALSFTTPAHAIPKYSSCTTMHDKFPAGVAKNASAATSVVTAGGIRPKVSPGTYTANKGLDRDKDGSVCEIQPKTSEFVTGFGIISFQSVAPPTAGTCVNVPISMDIRNMEAIVGKAFSRSLGMTVKLESRFGNVIGYETFFPLEKSYADGTLTGSYVYRPAAVYPINLKVCTEEWDSPVIGILGKRVSGYKPDESYVLNFAMWLDPFPPLGSSAYAFLK